MPIGDILESGFPLPGQREINFCSLYFGILSYHLPASEISPGIVQLLRACTQTKKKDACCRSLQLGDADEGLYKRGMVSRPQLCFPAKEGES